MHTQATVVRNVFRLDNFLGAATGFNYGLVKKSVVYCVMCPWTFFDNLL